MLVLQCQTLQVLQDWVWNNQWLWQVSLKCIHLETKLVLPPDRVDLAGFLRISGVKSGIFVKSSSAEATVLSSHSLASTHLAFNSSTLTKAFWRTAFTISMRSLIIDGRVLKGMWRLTKSNCFKCWSNDKNYFSERILTSDWKRSPLNSANVGMCWIAVLSRGSKFNRVTLIRDLQMFCLHHFWRSRKKHLLLVA